MEILVQRLNDGGDSTVGAIYIDGDFHGYTLEDQHQDVKVMHETRIPAGSYRIKYRKEPASKMNQRYSAKFDWFAWHLWLQDVPNFEWVYIHMGTNDDHTSGCILVGDSVNNNNPKAGRLGASDVAYERIYNIVANALDDGESVWITIRDEAEVV